MWTAVDDLAERIRALGFLAPRSYAEMAKHVILFLVPDRQLIYKDLKCKQDSSALLPVSAVVTA